MVNLCLVGFGRWGQVYLKEMENCADAKVVAIVSNNHDATSKINRNIAVYNKLDDALKHLRIDGVLLATPPKKHFTDANICLDSSIPLLLEKPCTTNRHELEALIDKSLRKGTLLVPGYQHLYTKNYATMKSALFKASGTKRLHSQSLSVGPIRSDETVLRDWGSHQIAMAIDLFEQYPSDVSVHRLKGDSVYCANYELSMSFGDSCRSHSVFGNLSNIKTNWTIAASEHGVTYINHLDRSPAYLTQDNRSLFASNCGESTTSPVSQMLLYFINAIRVTHVNDKILETAYMTATVLDKFNKPSGEK